MVLPCRHDHIEVEMSNRPTIQVGETEGSLDMLLSTLASVALAIAKRRLEVVHSNEAEVEDEVGRAA